MAVHPHAAAAFHAPRNVARDETAVGSAPVRPPSNADGNACTRLFATIRVMPELPEVERAVRTLRAVMEGARFRRVLVRRRRLRTRLPWTFASRLEGTTVRTLRRRGKYLVADLSGGGTLVMHLGMSGSFAVHRETSIAFTKHDHVIFHMSKGAVVVFNDPRRFGSMWLHDDPQDDPTSRLGPEPLDDAFGGEVLARALHGRRSPLKAALSDQRVIAGLGNIYAPFNWVEAARLRTQQIASPAIVNDDRAEHRTGGRMDGDDHQRPPVSGPECAIPEHRPSVIQKSRIHDVRVDLPQPHLVHTRNPRDRRRSTVGRRRESRPDDAPIGSLALYRTVHTVPSSGAGEQLAAAALHAGSVVRPSRVQPPRADERARP